MNNKIEEIKINENFLVLLCFCLSQAFYVILCFRLHDVGPLWEYSKKFQAWRIMLYIDALTKYEHDKVIDSLMGSS